MPDDNLPADPGPVVDAAPLSLDEAVAGLSSIPSSDPAPDPTSGEQDREQAAAKPEDDPLGMDVEDVGAEGAEAKDGSEEPEVKGGRFAPDSAKVTLDDGSVISVGELRRNNLFQRDYTQKTTALKAERDAFETERAQVSQYAQSLDQSRDYLAWYAETFLPKQPEPFKGDPAQDPMGYMQWQHQNSQWAAHVQAYQAFQQQRQQDAQLRAGENQKQFGARRNAEAAKLLEAIPVLKDKARGRQVWDAIVSGAGQHYGLSAEEVNGTADHRMIVVLRDALAYRRIKDKAPQVQAEVRKPAVTDGGRRAPPQARNAGERQVLSERFEQSRSLDDAAAKLRSLIS